jgi:type IV pilus assembly protein PilA
MKKYNSAKSMQGFTLIELMIVIAILGILMAIAIPAYQDYTIRAKVSEGMNLASAAKLAVAENRSSTGAWPATTAAAGVSSTITGNNVTSVTLVNGKITVAYTPSAGASQPTGNLVLSPTFTGGSVKWSCDSAAGTTVLSKYLPAACR